MPFCYNIPMMKNKLPFDASEEETAGEVQAQKEPVAENYDVNKVLAKQLVKYRTNAGYTQSKLASMLNYSDKSVSKWERGEGMPDLTVLVKLAEIYHCSVNDLLYEKEDLQAKATRDEKSSRVLIALLSAGIAWVVAALAFVVLGILPQTAGFAWLAFIYAVPASGIVLLVFSLLWGTDWLSALCASVVLWGTTVATCLTVHIEKIWLLAVLAGVLQGLLVLWFLLRHKKRKSKRNDE